MATERQAPDAILVMTELSGVVGDIDDDPDSPDGNWLVASGNNVNTDVRVSFPTPTGNPTVGADLQEFKTFVRQYDEGQGGTPDARIELWEDGNLIRASSDTPVPDGGLLLSFTWNANEISTADGSLVECKVVGTKSGGSPSNRNTVEVGAVEWNVEYSAAETYPLSVGGTVGALSGSLGKSTGKGLSGTMGSLTGSLSNIPTFVLSLSGATGVLSGALTKMTSKGLGGTVGALTGSLGKSTAKQLSGTLGTLSGGLSNAYIAVLGVVGTAGSIVGSLANQFIEGGEAIKLSVGGVISNITGSLGIYKLSLADHIKSIWRILRGQIR